MMDLMFINEEDKLFCGMIIQWKTWKLVSRLLPGLLTVCDVLGRTGGKNWACIDINDLCSFNHNTNELNFSLHKFMSIFKITLRLDNNKSWSSWFAFPFLRGLFIYLKTGKWVFFKWMLWFNYFFGKKL